MKELLLVNKYNPKTLDDIILLPRIRKLFENGVKQSYIFHGIYGAGKSSLASILVGKYSKKTPYLEINVSLETSIDTLRDIIEPFCRSVYMGLDLDTSYDVNNDFKYVYLDEYDKASHSAQEAFKAFSVEYENKGVRFILTTNHIDKINPGIRSRFVEVDFNPQNKEEEKYLKNELYKHIKNTILPSENINMEKDVLVSLINKNFPDNRAIIKMIENYKYTNEITIQASVSDEIRDELYNHIINDTSYDSVYHFLYDKIGPLNIGLLFSLLGRNFVKWYAMNRFNTNNLFEMNKVIVDYQQFLQSDSDPIILGSTVIGLLKKIHKGE